MCNCCGQHAHAAKKDDSSTYIVTNECRVVPSSHAREHFTLGPPVSDPSLISALEVLTSKTAIDRR